MCACHSHDSNRLLRFDSHRDRSRVSDADGARPFRALPRGARTFPAGCIEQGFVERYLHLCQNVTGGHPSKGYGGRRLLAPASHNSPNLKSD